MSIFHGLIRYLKLAGSGGGGGIPPGPSGGGLATPLFTDTGGAGGFRIPPTDGALGILGTEGGSGAEFLAGDDTVGPKRFVKLGGGGGGGDVGFMPPLPERYPRGRVVELYGWPGS